MGRAGGPSAWMGITEKESRKTTRRKQSIEKCDVYLLKPHCRSLATKEKVLGDIFVKMFKGNCIIASLFILTVSLCAALFMPLMGNKLNEHLQEFGSFPWGQNVI